MDMELFEGRPADCSGRQEREVRVYDLLDRLGIAYQRTDHEPAGTMEDCDRIDAVLEVTICKNLFLCNRQKTAFYLLMMPGNKAFRTKDLAAQLGGCPAELRHPGGHAASAGCNPRQRERDGADERPG